MIIGVDFDNTIVCYDAIFHRIAVKRGLIPSEVPATKTEVRNALRRVGQESAWIELQGDVYGPRLNEAEMFPGVKEFFRLCRMHEVIVKIISHKTRHPYAGEPHDLHAAALGWLRQNGFFAEDDLGLSVHAVFFELTKQAKLARIAEEECTYFIDDLPEFLADPAFPVQTQRMLFDPANAMPDSPAYIRQRSWTEVSRLIFSSTVVSVREQLSAAAAALFSSLNMCLAAPPVPIAGGANNRVFEARNEIGSRFLLKQYFFDSGEQRSRFEAERLFYGLTAVTAAEQTPRALAWDSITRVALFEFVDGRKLTADEIGNEELKEALRFLSALNRRGGFAEARALPAAADACFTLDEHCRSVDRRIDRLRTNSDELPIDRDARKFIADELSPIWNEVRAAVLGFAARADASESERCISPSDFGFHNSLRRKNGALVFFDFEYAGWDDPAKTVCDFFCQPALPAPAAAFRWFACDVAKALALRDVEGFILRCRVLLPLHRLKWCCIMLNEFVRADQSRRAFALGAAAVAERKANQLSAARDAIAMARTEFSSAVSSNSIKH